MLCGVNFVAGYEALMVAKKVLSHTTLSDSLKWSENLLFSDKKLNKTASRGDTWPYTGSPIRLCA